MKCSPVMSFRAKLLCAVLSTCFLSACLKVTGAAKDPFDLEEEQSPGIKLTVLEDTKPDPLDSDQINSGKTSLRPTPGNASTPLNSPLDDVDEKEYAEFQKWKRENDTNSAEYAEFNEFQNYKLWLEFRKKQSEINGESAVAD